MDSFGGSAEIGHAFSSMTEAAKSQNFDDTSDRITTLSLFQLLSAAKDQERRRNGQQDPQDKIREAFGADSPFSGHKGIKPEVSNAVDSTWKTGSVGESLGNDDDKSRNISTAEESPEAENGADMMKQPFLSSSISHQATSGTADIGSSSFSAASTSSGRLTFSGSLQFCDNISLRSNSTTSTTSFAFPILASEWNGSPIRLTEIDRRKHRRPKKSTCWGCFTGSQVL
ncbi:OLC1v1013960C1 [Oldenlandia corymbosa var. corymbosa]|uniref:OLC1v1013960C1 n=1 Tax=Oldenlandia corymbosa var. corymbosa TaxID=529605 RepID=A0AAV1E357_OLDCO|nr:OLC1v1013960C1 [Oldenlandia corymbosa var. corymbosa]